MTCRPRPVNASASRATRSASGPIDEPRSLAPASVGAPISAIGLLVNGAPISPATAVGCVFMAWLHRKKSRARAELRFSPLRYNAAAIVLQPMNAQANAQPAPTPAG